MNEKERPLSLDRRFIVGIDLGTTNCAVSYVQLDDGVGDRPAIRKFPVPQLTGPGEFGSLPVLPSFLYIPGEYDIADQDMAAPWTVAQRTRDDRNFVGAFARDHGAKVPARMVASAKSWLCNKAVDTHARILPWGAGDEVFKVSPVQASAAYLKHIREAWNVTAGDDDDGRLENQMVVITIPASFDEVARDLTLEAARMAGLPEVFLLEEPLAAFYSWLIGHEDAWSTHVAPGELILVCDVGGGTTDFSLISLQEVDGAPRFERIAVGNHLILGGDNMDIAIAHMAAGRLGESPEAMDRDAWKTLCHQCRRIKEQILAGAADSGRITLVGKGSRLIAGARSTTVNREEIESILLEQFFPMAAGGDVGAADAHEFAGGLTYEPNPSVTDHLLQFLDDHAPDVRRAIGRDLPFPDLVLFNGGALKAPLIQDRIRAAIGRRFSRDAGPRRLVNREMDLAVSLGAAYYGMVKTGIGVRVGSGSPRSFYIGLDAGRAAGKQAMCIVERGLEEGSRIALPQQDFEVVANQPVAIELYSSSFRSGDRSGDIVDIDDSFSALPALNTVIQFGDKASSIRIPVQLEASYTDVGTLEIWCRSIATPHRWQLRFQLRRTETEESVAEQEVFEAAQVDAAKALIQSAFSPQRDPSQLPQLVNALADSLSAPKDDWPLSLLRDLADTLIALMADRGRTAEDEGRWMNLLGFCLRPGTGEGFDPQRMKRLWKIYHKGPVHANAPQVRSEWWIMWRRVAAGLTAGQQRQFFQDISPSLTPQKGARIARQEWVEMWMAAANMERLQVKDKIALGRHLMTWITARKPQPQLLWALSRIGARDLLYGSIDRVVPPAEATRWIDSILGLTWKNPKPVVAMLTQLCRKTGDPLRDVDAPTRGRVVQWIASNGDFPEAQSRITEPSRRRREERHAVFGESLPAGLILANESS